MSIVEHDVRETTNQEHPVVTLSLHDRDLVYAGMYEYGLLHGWLMVKDDRRRVSKGTIVEAAEAMKTAVDVTMIKRCYGDSIKAMKTAIDATQANPNALRSAWVRGWQESASQVMTNIDN